MISEEPRLPEAASRLAASARCCTTDCGEGHLVWRVWGSGAPVVLLHGGSGSWTHWVRNIEPLVAAGHEVFVPDMPGFGDSAAPLRGEDADVSVEPLAAGLAQLVPGPFDLVGFSFGSLVATLLAAHVPRTRRLLLLGAPILPLSHGRGVPLSEWRHLRSHRERAPIHAANLRAIMLHRPESVTEEAIALHALNVPRDRMRRRRLVTTTLMADTLARMHCPTWLLYGSEDMLCRDGWSELTERIRRMPAIRGLHVTPAAGHWVQFEAAQEVNAQLLAVLAPARNESPEET